MNIDDDNEDDNSNNEEDINRNAEIARSLLLMRTQISMSPMRFTVSITLLIFILKLKYINMKQIGKLLPLVMIAFYNPLLLIIIISTIILI